ncbi:MAG: hypothetical protein EA344_12310 [Alkalicoccus sp.]|nr:MAG: hypothetical protein EA344_12310 [Alkalicoccus sp.]
MRNLVGEISRGEHFYLVLSKALKSIAQVVKRFRGGRGGLKNKALLKLRVVLCLRLFTCAAEKAGDLLHSKPAELKRSFLHIPTLDCNRAKNKKVKKTDPGAGTSLRVILFC